MIVGNIKKWHRNINKCSTWNEDNDKNHVVDDSENDNGDDQAKL